MRCRYCPHCQGLKKAAHATSQTALQAIIATTVAEAYHLEPWCLQSPQRGQHVVFVRYLAEYLTREMTELSFPAIGDYFKRDHSSVIHGCNIIASRLKERPLLAGEVARLRARIEAATKEQVAA